MKPIKVNGANLMQTHRIVNGLAAPVILFGVVTVLSGGRALFGSLEARAALGNVVPFVLWFNFLVGFVYILAGAGLWRRRRWSVYVSTFIAISTIIVFAAFGLYVMDGGVFETRTIGALTLRSLFWALIIVPASRLHSRVLRARASRPHRGLSPGKMPALPGERTQPCMPFGFRSKAAAVFAGRTDDQGPDWGRARHGMGEHKGGWRDAKLVSERAGRRYHLLSLLGRLLAGGSGTPRNRQL